MSYILNYLDEERNPYNYLPDKLERNISYLRENLEKHIDELIKNWDCDHKHKIMENILFNMWIHELRKASYDNLEEITGEYIEAVKNFVINVCRCKVDDN